MNVATEWLALLTVNKKGSSCELFESFALTEEGGSRKPESE
jgi:hypothetical protein